MNDNEGQEDGEGLVSMLNIFKTLNNIHIS